MRQLMGGLGLAALTIGALPDQAHARPWPGVTVRDPFRLSARSTTNIAVNRVSYGIGTRGEIGVDSLGRGTTGGGFWPRGTVDQYMFNSGIQLAGVIAGSKGPTNPWGTDTVSAKFFDPIGSQRHGDEVIPAYRSFDPVDVAAWPDVALVPDGDFSAELFDPLLRGKKAASQGDAYWISWDGNPGLITGRLHPMGVVLEHRLLQWNYPAGNDDVMYLLATAYNVTTTNAAAYEEHRPALREILLQKAAEFQELNNAAFNITLPAEGMTYDPFYMAWAADPDVGTGSNYSAVNLPFALGYIYQPDFSTAAGWVFPPEIFSAPFFPGVGFFGAKYLKSPQGPGRITLFSTTINGGDPSPGQTLYRWMKGDPPSGSCTVADPLINRVCRIDQGGTNNAPRDLRMFQSASPMTFAPGDAASVVVAYIHAAPVKLDGYTPVTNQFINQLQTGGKTLWIGSVDSMTARGGVTRVDSLTGYRRYTGPIWDTVITDGVVDSVKHVPLQNEFEVVRGSLLDKALVAQLIFDNKFLLPFSPANPDFFLIPGDKKVQVLWRPSSSEVDGDPYFAVASSATLVGGDPNNLYDPNFREKDVEGYRVYRGRSDNPASLQLLAQFDYAGTTIRDFGGNISRSLTECAPELGQRTTAFGCSANFPDQIRAGVTSTVSASFDITSAGGALIQVLYGQRTLLQSGKLLYLAADTLMTSAYYVQLRGAGGTGYPALNNSGVPFTFVDEARADCAACGVINGVNYYYSVTAFDVNSLRSGPVSLESARATKQVTVGSVAANFDNSFTTQTRVVGRTPRTDNVVPTLDPSTGRFSKAFPPSNSLSIKLASFIPQLLRGTGTISMQLDSMGRPVMANGAASQTTLHYFTLTPATGTPLKLSVNVTLNANTPAGTGTTAIVYDSVSGGSGAVGSAPFTAMAFDPALVSVYGGTAEGYAVQGTWTLRRARGTYVSSWGRGCANTGSTVVYGFFWNVTPRCFYNGPRWYSGANETLNHPTAQTPWVFNPALVPQANRRYSNAGQLPGVTTVHFPASYAMLSGGATAQALGWQAVETALGQFVTAADYRLFWGANGVVDSVVDLTHDLPVPFKTEMNASWGILNSNSVPQSMRYSRRDVLTVTDVSCVYPLKRYRAVNNQRASGFANDSVDAAGNVLGIPCQTPLADSANVALAIPLVNQAVPGPIAFFNDTLNRVKRVDAAPQAPNNGFLLYIKGRIFMFELTGGQVPAAGTQWNLRDYVGAISGGIGDAGDLGPYRFFGVPLPFTAVGAKAEFNFDVTNVVEKPTAAAMAKIKTVPDPYYVTSAYDPSVTVKTIKFLNVPTGARVRIYSSAGILVTELLNTKGANDGTVAWNVRNRSNQFVASGPYFWVVESDGVKQTGRMVVVNNAANVN